MLCLKRNVLLVLPFENQLISEFAGSGSCVTGSKLFCRCVAAIMRTCTDWEESAAAADRQLLNCLTQPFFSSISTSRATSLSVSKTPLP